MNKIKRGRKIMSQFRDSIRHYFYNSFFLSKLCAIALTSECIVPPDDWTIIYGNITKLGLGLAAMFFDMVFFIQHGIYGKKNDVILYESL